TKSVEKHIFSARPANKQVTKSRNAVRNIRPLYGITDVGVRMALLPHKGLLAIAAVIDVALHGKGRPVSAKALAARHSLPARHLEPVLQALVRMGILRGIRGPRGGYELARERRRITADDILRA